MWSNTSGEPYVGSLGSPHVIVESYHYLGYDGNRYGYFTDVLCGDIPQTTKAGLYYDFIPDKGWSVLSDYRVGSPSN